MLSDAGLKRLAVKEKRYLVSDGGGLWVEVMPNGRRYWRLRMTVDGREYRRSLGMYPDVSLKEARLKRDEIRLRMARGDNPLLVSPVSGNTFEEIAREWFSRKVLPTRSPEHCRTVLSRMEHWIFPWIGRRSLAEITPGELLALLRRCEVQGKIDTTHRIKRICGQVWRYAISTGAASTDPTGSLQDALVSYQPKHHPTLTDPARIGAFLRALEGLNGGVVVRCAVRLGVLTFVRPGELRRAEWEEFDIPGRMWKIRAEKMKMRRPHLVPLSRQSVEALEEIRPITGHGRYVFPSARTMDRPMSDATVNAALRRLGYAQDELTGHGFRAMASTALNESGRWPVDAIERQLAHVERNAVRAAYNHAEHLEVRREMMQWWADWLDGAMAGGGRG